MTTQLRCARVVGFFSLPPASLAEHNPAAYVSAMADAPAGSGTCSQCGMGIRNHVVIEEPDGSRRFIGTDCAVRVGVPAEQLRCRLTDDERALRDAERQAIVDARAIENARLADEHRAFLADRWQRVGDIVQVLRRLGGSFYCSLASQLEERPLSLRQAHFVAKATSETGRRNKRNAAAWDDVIARCTE